MLSADDFDSNIDCIYRFVPVGVVLLYYSRVLILWKVLQMLTAVLILAMLV